MFKRRDSCSYQHYPSFLTPILEMLNHSTPELVLPQSLLPPLLHYPKCIPTPKLVEQILPLALQNAQWRERYQQAVTHAAIVTQAEVALQVSLALASQNFAPQSPISPIIEQQAPTEPPASETPSPEPLPIPPRMTTPVFELGTPVIFAPPLYASPPPRYSRPDSPVYVPQSPTPDSPSNSPQSYTHPGGDWMVNLDHLGQQQHNIMIPVGLKNEEATPFFHYNFNMGSPELLTTRGQNCHVYTRFLHAQPRPYPCKALTKRQCLLFQP